MERILPRFLRLCAMLALCAFAVQAHAQSVTGNAVWRERIALPSTAVFEAVLQDVSRADTGAPILGRTRLVGPGQPPIAFEIPYDATRIRPDARYGVSARIRVGDRLVMVTDRLVPVLTRGAGTNVELMMRSAGRQPPGGPTPPGEPATPQPPISQRGADPLGAVPASFAGALPCSDCEAMDWHLDLLPGNAYRLTRAARGASRPRLDTIGRWRVDGGQRALFLREADDTELRLDIVDRDTLRWRASSVQAAAQGDPTLRRRGAFEPAEPRMSLDGIYSAMADAATIVLCATGERLPVATEGDNAALERAYGALRRQPAEPMLVTLDARIAQRPPMEGRGLRATVIPERFIGAWPREGCATPERDVPLEETYWRLTRLRGAPVELSPRMREPHLIFRRDGRLAGSGGCNRLVGGYLQTLEQLDIAGLGATRMACADGMQQEARFTSALGEVARWRVSGRHLDLYDVGGERILRFEAIALR